MTRAWILALALFGAPALIQCSKPPEPPPPIHESAPPPPPSAAEARFTNLETSIVGDYTRVAVHHLEQGQYTTFYGRVGRWIVRCSVANWGRFQGSKRCALIPTTGQRDTNRLSLLRYETTIGGPEIELSWPSNRARAWAAMLSPDETQCAGADKPEDLDPTDFVLAALQRGESCRVTLARSRPRVTTIVADGFEDAVAFAIFVTTTNYVPRETVP